MLCVWGGTTGGEGLGDASVRSAFRLPTGRQQHIMVGYLSLATSRTRRRSTKSPGRLEATKHEIASHLHASALLLACHNYGTPICQDLLEAFLDANAVLM